MEDPLRARPPVQTLAWVVDVVGAEGLEGVHTLRGGRVLANHRVTLRMPGGHRLSLVLRRWARPGWAERDAAYGPQRELRTLAALSGAPVPVPAVIASDVEGQQCDVPALLVTLLGGRPPDAALLDQPATLQRLAQVAATLHEVPGVDAVPRWEAYVDAGRARPPAGSARPDLWTMAIDVAAAAPPASRQVFLHRDYHPGNTLWHRGRLTGIVDWTSASRGDPGVDVSHMRWNLAVLVGLAAADAFRDAYERATGHTPDPWWDVRTAVDLLEHDPGWPLQSETLRALEHFLEVAIARVAA